MGIPAETCSLKNFKAGTGAIPFHRSQYRSREGEWASHLVKVFYRQVSERQANFTREAPVLI
ncbi:hypothetical protein MHB50_01320 [Siminovitchia sp. FSL H7-0308]|uniref:hypothetical protein n=1 Tax=Siminovitchia sp. FSL H7-0308 TaxID=2921432 RepID=UPI0030ECF5CC